MSTALSFLDAVAGYVDSGSRSSADRPIRLATVDPAYTPWVAYPAAPPPARVTFDGESTLSGKAYPYASGFIPWAGSRVVLVPIGNSYLITGALSPQTPQGFWQNAAGTESGVEFGGGSFYDTDEGLVIAGDAAVSGDTDLAGQLLHSSRNNRVPEIQYGSTAANGPGAGTSITVTATFPVAWPAGTTVMAFAQIIGAAGVTSSSMVRVSPTVTNLSIVILKTDAARANYVSGDNFTVHWVAFARPAVA
jgi:hypothetical protein